MARVQLAEIGPQKVNVNFWTFIFSRKYKNWL